MHWPTDKELQFCGNAFVSFVYHNFARYQEKAPPRRAALMMMIPSDRSLGSARSLLQEAGRNVISCIRNITHILILVTRLSDCGMVVDVSYISHW